MRAGIINDCRHLIVGHEIANRRHAAESMEHHSHRKSGGSKILVAGERGIAAQKMDAFVESLRKVYNGTIHRVDERMTTAQATIYRA